MPGSSRAGLRNRFVSMLMTEGLAEQHSALKLSGEIDLLQAPVLRAALQAKAARKCPVLIIDLSEVPFMDSSGLSELIAYEQGARAFGGKLFIVGLRPEIRQLFSLARLDGFFRTFDSADAAILTLAES